MIVTTASSSFHFQGVASSLPNHTSLSPEICVSIRHDYVDFRPSRDWCEMWQNVWQGFQLILTFRVEKFCVKRRRDPGWILASVANVEMCESEQGECHQAVGQVRTAVIPTFQWLWCRHSINLKRYRVSMTRKSWKPNTLTFKYVCLMRSTRVGRGSRSLIDEEAAGVNLMVKLNKINMKSTFWRGHVVMSASVYPDDGVCSRGRVNEFCTWHQQPLEGVEDTSYNDA